MFTSKTALPPLFPFSLAAFQLYTVQNPFLVPFSVPFPHYTALPQKASKFPPNPLIFNQKKARLTRAFTQGERIGGFKALRFVVVCPVLVYCLRKMKKRAGEVGKTSPAVLRWEPSELKKERTSFFAAGECWLGAIPTNVGKPAARDILHFLRAEARKKGGKWGENEKKA